MQSPIRLLIAEDMLPIREYLSLILTNEPDMDVIDSVSSGAAAVERAMKMRPNVILMDLEMETPRAGVDAIQLLAVRAPEIRCVVLTHFCDDETVFAAFEAGAVDYILKNSSAVEILEAIRAAAQGRSTIRPQIARMIREEFRALRSERARLVSTLNVVYKLTPTELSLLRLLAEGWTQSQIAGIRHIEASTVRTHVGNILKKFGKPSIQEVVGLLKRLGIFEVFVKEEQEL
jgi:DNA-binding NarL/FixJ family response regulator